MEAIYLRLQTEIAVYWSQVDDKGTGCLKLSVLLLVESPRIHKIFSTLSNAEQKWIADEVNTVLTCIRGNAPTSP